MKLCRQNNVIVEFLQVFFYLVVVTFNNYAWFFITMLILKHVQTCNRETHVCQSKSVSVFKHPFLRLQQNRLIIKRTEYNKKIPVIYRVILTCKPTS